MRSALLLTISAALVVGLAQAATVDPAPVRPAPAGDELLPVKSRAGEDDLQPVRSRAGEDDLLPVRSRAGDDDLLPVESRAGAPTPRPPARPGPSADPAAKADLGPPPSPTGTFDFDLVVGFNALAAGEGLVTSYYFLDRQQGHCGMDPGAMRSLGTGAPTGDAGGRFDFQVFTRQAGIYTYMTSNEFGRFYLSMPTGAGFAADFESFSDGQHFEEAFQPTGQRRGIGANLAGKPYDSVEYRGIDPETGDAMSLWLAVPDFEPGYYAATCWGLGVVTLPGAGQQRLVTRVEGQGAVYELSYVKREQNRFSGAGYRDVGALLPGMGMPGG